MGCSQSKDKDEEQLSVGEPVQGNERDHFAIIEQPGTVDFDDDANVAAAGQAKTSSKFKGEGPQDENGNSIGESDSDDVFGHFADGLLYRIKKANTWYYYNDTDNWEMKVKYRFGPDSELQPGEGVDFEKSGEDGWFDVAATIYPGETKVFITGDVNGYKSTVSTAHLSDEYLNKIKSAVQAKIDEQTEKVKAVAGSEAAKADKSGDVLDKCVETGDQYVDLCFPPNDSSLGGNLKGKAWRRPTDYLAVADHDKIRAVKVAEPGDIDQGALGDCWFLCSMASLAEFPEKIKDIFQHPDSDRQKRRAEEKLGGYHVTINKHGWWETYIMDDYFPCTGKRPCFAKCVEDPGELWVSLLEKAYARAHGSYDAIVGGDAMKALEDLTGCPTNDYGQLWEKAAKGDKAASKELFDKMLEYDKHDYLQNVNTPGQDDSAYMGASGANNSKEFSERYKKAGLGMGHAYSVLTVKEFPSFPGGHLRLLQIRNPWGNGTEWTGSWGDEDERWTKHADVATSCNFSPGSDGTFWMEWEDVLQYFDGGGVCFLKFDWHDYRAKGSFKSGIPSCALEIKVTGDKPVKAWVTLSQKDKRGLPSSDPDAKYKAMLLTVCQPTDKPGQMEGHLSSNIKDITKPGADLSFGFARDFAVEYTFKPREEPYLVVPRAYDKNLSGTNYTLGLISDLPVDGKNVQVKFKSLPKDCRFFQYYPKFNYTSADVPDCETQYQYNPEVGCPVTYTGKTLDVKYAPAAPPASQGAAATASAPPAEEAAAEEEKPAAEVESGTNEEEKPKEETPKNDAPVKEDSWVVADKPANNQPAQSRRRHRRNSGFFSKIFDDLF